MTGRRHNPYFRRFLVGYDGSAESEKAVDVALALGEYMDSTVLVFAVARFSAPGTSAELAAELDDTREHFEQGFKRIIEKASAHDLRVETAMAAGHPAQQIIHRADVDRIDLIILGRRETSVFKKLILGSVSDRVIRYAHCPVMVVQ